MSTGPDKRDDRGPFDIIGDVHGCADELERLLRGLGYIVAWHGKGHDRACSVKPPVGRTAVFAGDLVDRGQRVPDVLRIVMSMVADGSALCVPGNHDVKVARWLDGAEVNASGGMIQTMAQMQDEPQSFRDEVKDFIEGLPIYLWLDDGQLVVAHAGLREDMIGLDGRAVRAFCLYGDTTGQQDKFGLPVRRDWAAQYRGKPHVVYGHTPVQTAVWRNRTICIDTGCVFGGKLTALRWPERELVSVAAEHVYTAPSRPLDVLTPLP